MELHAKGLVKRHPGVLALDDASLVVRPGEVHAVVGENGAGKSTLMRILSGAALPDSGTITIDGRPVTLDTPHAAHSLGIRMIHQELALVPGMSVAENICLGAEPSKGGVVDRVRQAAIARAALDSLGQSHLDVDSLVAELPLAARQMTEIAKAMAQSARLLMLDEPTAILAHDEAEALFRVIAQLRAKGVAVVYISHRLDEVFRLADQVTILRDGRVVRSGALAEFTRGEIVKLMVGRDLAAGYPAATSPPSNEILRLKNITSGVVHDASLALRRGEIVALVGLVGAGRTELLRTIFGAEVVSGGSMWIDGARFKPHSPRDAIRAGIALLPEDRKGQGLVLRASLRENVTLATVPERWGVVNRPLEQQRVATWIDALNIRTPGQEQAVRLLSGGNQQKVVLARWMLANAKILLFDEPTRGIDVGAKAEIYALMRRLTDEGAAILMVSSDLPEALGMADRVIVMRDGRVVGELSRAEAKQERVAALILGESVAA